MKHYDRLECKIMPVIELTRDFVSALLPQRREDSNKGTYGKVLNIAGSVYYQGAAYLSSLAPLKTGAGLVTLATMKQVVNNLAAACPWVTFLPLETANDECIAQNAFSQVKDYIDTYSVVSLGPGLSTADEVSGFTKEVIKYLTQTNKTSAIDADALNVIAASDIEHLYTNAVITPHPMELSRLINVPVEQIQKDRVNYALQAAQKFGCNVVLKGNKTVICTTDGNVYINTRGNSALAKAGSGDVLTGIISGLIAQGGQVKHAAILGVYLHGLCGEIASKTLTQYSVLATDQIDCIPDAIKQIR